MPSIFARPMDGALAMHAYGFLLFPVHPNDKVPIKGWQAWAESCTEQRIRDFGTANPSYNWGIYCGPSHLLVLDVDTKNGKKGLESLQELEVRNQALPRTLTVRTPSGGTHFYFKGASRTTAGVLGEGLDTRGEGGYVLAPGSRIGDRTYEVTVVSEGLQPLPEWLGDLIREKAKPVTLGQDVPEEVPEGRRNTILASLAGTMRARGMNYDSILAALLTVNETQLETPMSEIEVEHIARSVARYAPQEAKAASDFLEPVRLVAKTADRIDLAKIPKRDWVMKNRYAGGFISVLISPGGVGKSTVALMDALSISTGTPYTGFDVVKPGPVWLYNTEDPQDELDRRVAAAALHNNIPFPDLKNLHVTSGRDTPLILVKFDQGGLAVNKDAMDGAVDYIRQHGIVLLLVDPFVRTHEVDENSNMQIDKVVWCFSRIAERTGCAIGLVHHTSKAGARQEEQGDMHTGRGATSLVYAARIAHTLAGMSEKEAERFGVPEDKRRWYLRLDNAKANMQPPASRADWFERVSIVLPNTDDVGVVQRVPLQDVVNEKSREQFKAERKDLAFCLSTLMQPGQELPALDVFNQVTTKADFAHLFTKFKSERRGFERLMALMENGLQFQNMLFKVVYSPSRRPKYHVVCSNCDFLL